MASKALRKKLFGVKALSDITLDDIQEQEDASKSLRRLLGKAEYQRVRTFLSELREQKEDELERVAAAAAAKKAKYAKMRSKYDKEAVARDKRAADYVAKRVERNKFLSVLKEVSIKKNKIYLVGYSAGIEYKVNGGVRQEQVVISAELTADKNESRFEMLERAKDAWIQKNIDDGIWTKPYDFKVLWRRNVFVVPVVDNALALIPMNGVMMLYCSLPELANVKVGECVKSYIYHEGRKKESRVEWTHAYLDKWKLKTTADIVAFAKAHNFINVYAVDMVDNVYEVYTCSGKARMWLMFKNNNNHLYPITDPALRQAVVKSGSLNLQEIALKYKDYEAIDVLKNIDVERDAKGLLEDDEVPQKECVIVKDVADLSFLAAQYMMNTGHLLERYTFRNGDMVAFQHPTREQVFLAAPEYDLRKAICAKREAKYKLADDKFVNQSIAKIGRTILDNTFGKIPESRYSPDLKQIFTQYPVSPVRWCKEKTEKHISIDIAKCYPTALRDAVEDWPVFSPFDCIQPVELKSVAAIKAGFYYTDGFTMGASTIRIQRGFHTLPLIKHALRSGYITLADIKYAIYARGSFRANAFKKFVEQTMAEYGSQGKHLVNHTIGGFGSLYHRSEKAGITTDVMTAMATRNEYKDSKTTLTPIGDFFAL